MIVIDNDHYCLASSAARNAAAVSLPTVTIAITSGNSEKKSVTKQDC